MSMPIRMLQGLSGLLATHPTTPNWRNEDRNKSSKNVKMIQSWKQWDQLETGFSQGRRQINHDRTVEDTNREQTLRCMTWLRITLYKSSYFCMAIYKYQRLFALWSVQLLWHLGKLEGVGVPSFPCRQSKENHMQGNVLTEHQLKFENHHFHVFIHVKKNIISLFFSYFSSF